VRRSVARARERILDAAEDLFADQGFDATPTAAVAAQAEVPKGLVFHYFPRKVDLLAALARERPPSAASAEIPGGGDLVAALLAVAHRFQSGQDGPMQRILLRDCVRHPDLRAALDRLYQQVLDQIREVIDHVIPHGHPDHEARQAAAVTFAAALMHATHHHHLTGSRFDLSPVAATICTGLIGHPATASG